MTKAEFLFFPPSRYFVSSFVCLVFFVTCVRVIHSIGHDVRVFGSKKQKKREISSAKDRKSLFFLFIFEEKGRKRRKKRKKEEEKKKEKKNARKTSFSFHRAFATRADIYFLNVDSRASGRRARVFRPPFRCARSRKGKTLRRDPFSIQRWRLKKKRIYSCVLRLERKERANDRKPGQCKFGETKFKRARDRENADFLRPTDRACTLPRGPPVTFLVSSRSVLRDARQRFNFRLFRIFFFLGKKREKKRLVAQKH
jgi:hypothetical protein